MAADLPSSPGVRFQPITGLDGYAVGDDGTVWSRHRKGLSLPPGWRQVRVYRRPYGSRYCVVSLRAGGGRGKVVCRYVHRLVLEAFAGACPDGCQCLHRDGDTANNRFANLRWGTVRENAADRIRHGTHAAGARSPCAKLGRAQVRRILVLRGAGFTHRQIADEMGIGRATVGDVLAGKKYRCDSGL